MGMAKCRRLAGKPSACGYIIIDSIHPQMRHGFAIHALSKGVPLNMVSKWMGYAKMETTAIYCNAVGEEQQSIAARMWA